MVWRWREIDSIFVELLELGVFVKGREVGMPVLQEACVSFVVKICVFVPMSSRAR
jgi:hypothetical protein